MISSANPRKAWAEPLWVLTLAVLLSTVVFVVNLGVKGPMIQGDEGSYLGNAAAVAGFCNDMASSYYSGYSILISPAFLLGDTPPAVWMVVKVINSLLFFSVVILLWKISKQWEPNLSLKKRSMAVVLVSLYPMWVIMVGYSFSQIAVVPVYLLMVLFFFEVASGKAYAWPVLGGWAGYLYWIHPTAVVALIATCIVLFYVAWKMHWYKGFFIFLAVLISVVLTYRIGIQPWLMDRMTISGQLPNSNYPTITKMFSTLFSWNGFKIFLSVFGGHVFYLSIGALGFVVSGCIVITKLVLKSTSNVATVPEEFALKASGVFILLTLFGIVLLSAIFMSGGPNRLDHWMYGRYVEGFIAPVILAGVLASSWRQTLWAIPTAVLGAGLLCLSLDSYIHTAPFNVSTFWQEFVIRDKGLLLWLLTGATMVALIGLLSRPIAYIVAICFFCFCSYLQIKYHNRDSNSATSRWEAALVVRDQFPRGTCVGFDHAGINSYNRHIFWFDFGFVLFDYHLQRMSFKKWSETCDGPLFSYDKHLNEQNPGVYPAALSPHGGPILWVKGKQPLLQSYPIIVSEHSAMLLILLSGGWHALERAHVWSSAAASINLKKNMFAGDKWPKFIKLLISAYAATNDRPVMIEVCVGGQHFEFKYTDSSRKTMKIPIVCKSDSVQCAIDFLVDVASSPQALGRSSDSRVLGFALYSFTFEGLDN